MSLLTRTDQPPREAPPRQRAGTSSAHGSAAGSAVNDRTGPGGKADTPEIASASLTMPMSQLVLFTRQMSMLLTSGSGLVPAINAIAPQMKSPKHRDMLENIHRDLEEGVTLTAALARYPRVFNAAYCAVVAAGESSAQLPAMFARLALMLGKRRAMRNRVIGSLIYPALLILLSIKILAVMVFFVVPRFAGMFDTLGVEVPASTRALMGLADLGKSYWYLIVLGVAAGVGGLYFLIRDDRGQQFASNVQIRIPVVGHLVSRLIQGQTFRILGMLLEARVGLLEALDLARRVTRNNRFQKLYDRMRDSVTRGESISSALEGDVPISPSIVQAVRTGEQSGRLGEAVTYIADVLDEENSEILNATTKLIEPLVLIIMGIIVGTVAISLFMPLFDMTAAV
jgi:type IV pilus assembly protein PilC